MASCILEFTEVGKVKVEAIIQEWEDANDSELDYNQICEMLLDSLSDKQMLHGYDIIWGDIPFKMGLDIQLQKGLYNVKTV